MRRLASVTLIPLFAIFCLALPGSAAAATGTAPAVSGGFPPLIGAVLTSAPVATGDSMAWGTCDANSNLIGSGYLATGTTYTLQSTDARTDVCAVELDPTGLIVMGVSDPIGPVGTGPSLNAAGTAVTQGQTVSVTQGAWGAGASTPTDTWYRCDSTAANCAPIESAPGVAVTGLSYTTTRSDVGSTIEVQETATSAAGTSASVMTAPTGVVVATPPANMSPPTVSGTAQVGDTLIAVPGSWSNQPTSFSYQWERCSSGTCTAIQNATSSTYVPVAADIGDILVVSVAGVIDSGTAYGAMGSPYPSYPTNPVVGIASSPAPAPAPSPVVPVPQPRRPKRIGRLTATMQWTFRYAPSYTQILAFAVDGPALRSTITTRCRGKGCPLRVHRISVSRLKHCSTTTGVCRAPRTVNLESEFRHHKLGIGARVTIMISRPHDIGKYYRFIVRPRRAPSVRIRCLAPGSVRPGKGCTGL